MRLLAGKRSSPSRLTSFFFSTSAASFFVSFETCMYTLQGGRQKEEEEGRGGEEGGGGGGRGGGVWVTLCSQVEKGEEGEWKHSKRNMSHSESDSVPLRACAIHAAYIRFFRS